jgi:hypothetical protein
MALAAISTIRLGSERNPFDRARSNVGLAVLAFCVLANDVCFQALVKLTSTSEMAAQCGQAGQGRKVD